MKQQNARSRAICLMLTTALCFSTMQVAVKLSSGTIGTMQQVFSRNLISMLVSFLLLRRKKLSLFGGWENQGALMLRSLLGFLGVAMLFTASAGARQADISIINRTSPIWVSLFAALLLKEKLPKIQLPVIALCLAGCFVAMRPSFDSNALPLLLAFLTAISSGLAYTMIAYCRGRVNPLTVIFHFSTFSTIAGGLCMLPHFVVPSLRDLGLLCLIGLCGSCGQISLTYAYQLAPAAEVSIYDYFGILFSALMGYFLLGETVGLSTVLGGSLIVGGALWSYLYHRRRLGRQESPQASES